MNELYQIGVPVEKLSTVMMLWDSYERPCKLLISPAKTEGLAVVELRHMVLSSEIVKLLPECKLKIVNEPVKIIKI